MKHCLPDMELSNNAGMAGNGESRAVTESVVASFKEARDINSSVPAMGPFPALPFSAISALPAF